MQAILLRQKETFEIIIIRKHKTFDVVFSSEEPIFAVDEGMSEFLTAGLKAAPPRSSRPKRLATDASGGRFWRRFSTLPRSR
jgi:hypothetical protein